MVSPTSVRRWLVFNAVGAIGIAVQLCALLLLLRAGLPVALATLAAVELTILHNFFWHERWTWRSTRGSADRAGRLLRFHALNGIVSLVGNVAITSALVQLSVHPLLANIAAITICSTVNFFAADRLVFRAVVVALALLAVPGRAAAGDDTFTLSAGPTAATLAAWDKYVATVEARYWKASDSFFALDLRQAPNWRERAKTMVPMVEVPPTAVSDGKIHHWAGAIYVPNTTVAAVVKRMQDYAGRESEFYQEVKASKLLERNGDKLRVFMRLERRAFKVTGTYNTEHAVEYRTLSAQRASSRSVSTKIAELDDAGTASERELPAGKDSGFLWRLNAYWRFEQVGTGVLIECESVSLSRAVPWALRPFVTGLVEGVARESLENTLRSLRTFLGR